MAKPRIKQEIIDRIQKLRKIGRSIPEISRLCEVSRSSACRYSYGVSIPNKYLARLRQLQNTSKNRSDHEKANAQRWVCALIPDLSRSGLILIASALYWAEGSKRDFGLSNTDPKMVRVFIQILRSVFEIKDADLKISIRIYEDLNREHCLKYWSEITGIKLGHKTSVNVLHGSKNGKLPYGMCRIRVRKGGFLLKKIFAVIERINELSPRSSMDRITAS